MKWRVGRRVYTQQNNPDDPLLATAQCSVGGVAAQWPGDQVPCWHEGWWGAISDTIALFLPISVRYLDPALSPTLRHAEVNTVTSVGWAAHWCSAHCAVSAVCSDQMKVNIHAARQTLAWWLVWSMLWITAACMCPGVVWGWWLWYGCINNYLTGNESHPQQTKKHQQSPHRVPTFHVITLLVRDRDT